MADTEANVKINVTADASTAKTEMAALTKGVTNVGAEAKKTSKGFSDFVDGMAVGLGKFNQAWEGLTKLAQGAVKALDSAQAVHQMQALEASLPTKAVQGLRDAMRGQLEQSEAVRLTSRALSGDFKITATQLEHLGQAAEAAERNGFGPAKENLEKMLDAVQDKGIGKLDDFGVALKSTGDHTKDVALAIQALDGTVANTAPMDERTRKLLEVKEAFTVLGDELKIFGAYAVDTIADIFDAMTTAFDDERMGKKVMVRGSDGKLRSQATIANEARKQAIFDKAAAQQNAAYVDQWDAGMNLLGTVAAPKKQPRGARGGGGRAATRPADDVVGKPLSTGDMAAMNWMDTSEGFMPTDYRTQRDRLFDGIGPTAGGAGGIAGAFDKAAVADGGLYSKENPLGTFLDATTEKSRVAGEALGAFGDAAKTAFAAYLDGSDSFAGAMKKASAGALIALSTEWAARAIGEGAWALSSLAVGDIRGAGQHGLAAAQWGVAAAAAGAGAKLLGGGGGGKGGGGGGGASSSPGAAGGGFAAPRGGASGAQPMVINLSFGDGFYGDRREVAAAVADGFREAQRSGARTSYTTKWQRG